MFCCGYVYGTSKNYVSNMESSRVASCFDRISLSAVLQGWGIKHWKKELSVCLTFTSCNLDTSEVWLCFSKTNQHSSSLDWDLVQKPESLQLSSQHLKSCVLSKPRLKLCSWSTHLILTHWILLKLLIQMENLVPACAFCVKENLQQVLHIMN